MKKNKKTIISVIKKVGFKKAIACNYSFDYRNCRFQFAPIRYYGQLDHSYNSKNFVLGR